MLSLCLAQGYPTDCCSNLPPCLLHTSRSVPACLIEGFEQECGPALLELKRLAAHKPLVPAQPAVQDAMVGGASSPAGPAVPWAVPIASCPQGGTAGSDSPAADGGTPCGSDVVAQLDSGTPCISDVAAPAGSSTPPVTDAAAPAASSPAVGGDEERYPADDEEQSPAGGEVQPPADGKAERPQRDWRSEAAVARLTGQSPGAKRAADATKLQHPEVQALERQLYNEWKPRPGKKRPFSLHVRGMGVLVPAVPHSA